MTAVVKKVRIKNFEGYKDESIEFTAGLNLVAGRNSTGKTTLLDAITFGLFGDVPGVKSSTLVSRFPGTSSMKTLVEFNGARGEQAQVLRVCSLGQKGEFKTEDKKLVVNGKEVQIEGEDDMRTKVAELIGINLRRFHSLVYVRQGEMSNILAPNKEQMDSLLQITLLRELRDQFDEVRKQYEKWDGNDVVTLISNTESMLGEKRKELQHVVDDAKLLEAEVLELANLIRRSESKELVSLLAQIDNRDRIADELGKIEVKMEEILREYKANNKEDMEIAFESIRKEFEERSAKRAALEKQVEQEMNEWSKATGLVSSIEKELESHEKMLKSGTAVCTTCGQNISQQKLVALIDQESLELSEAKKLAATAYEKYDTDRKAVEGLNDAAKYTYMINELAESIDDLNNFSAKTEQLRADYKMATNQIKTGLAAFGLPFAADDLQLAVKIAQKLPIGVDELATKKQLLAAKQQQLASKNAYMDSVKQWIAQAENRYSLLKSRLAKASMAKSFSAQFGQAIESRRKDLLASIEFKAFEYYKKLTDQQVYSGFTIDPEDYTVCVNLKGLTQEILATRVGGGHQTLIALSIRLALMDVTKCKSLLLLDEPTDGIDNQNMPQLAGYLAELSKFIDQIIMVTHFNICEESADNLITIISDQAGSRVARP
jgi:DNA repair exonuclease SbcCD ATPase subunit